jgi:hypothetical protein
MTKNGKPTTPRRDEAEQNPVNKKGGMPRFEPTDEQRKAVETMAGHGIPHVDIARVVINPRTGRGIDPTTLRSAFRHELDVGHVKANSAVAESLYQQAIKGNVTAAIWWTKARMGWKETTVQHFQDADGNPIGPTINFYGRPEHPSAPETVDGTRH